MTPPAEQPATLSGERAAVASEPKRTRPVLLWAVAGGLFVFLQVYILIHWIGSGPSPTPIGADPVPGWMKVSVHTQEALSVLALLAFVYFLLIRPWRREGRITLDGLFVLAFPWAWWQEPLLNYTQTWGTYNAEVINLGSWGASIPGAVAPNLELFVEALLWTGPAYVWAVFGAVVLSNKLMAKAKARWPEMSNAKLIAGTFAFFIVFDLVAESFWVRTGIYAYPGAIEELTLFHGNYYQFPIYEAIFFGGTWATWACLRFFRNDKGQTFAERGIDRVLTSPRRRTGVRYLALVGVINVVFLVGTMIPFQWFGMHADPWPEDFQNRSYLRNGLCGEDTDYACSGPKVPIPRRDSAHLNPEGELVVPPGVELGQPSE